MAVTWIVLLRKAAPLVVVGVGVGLSGLLFPAEIIPAEKLLTPPGGRGKVSASILKYLFKRTGDVGS
jgi:hypothetical protein